MLSAINSAQANMTPREAKNEKRLRQSARKNFLAYCQYVDPRYETPAHVQLLAAKLQQVALYIASGGKKGIGRLMIFMPPQHGKALALDTPIPTPDGWKRIDELKVGDAVFDENGNICEVVNITPVWKDRPVYQICTDDGDCIVADAEHEWFVRMDRKRKVFSIRTTKFIAERKSLRSVMIQKNGMLNLPEKELLIDPYVLGVWLGDGDSSGASITKGVDDQIFIREQIELAGYKTTDHANVLSFGVLDLHVKLRELDLLNNKHIPQNYLRASAAQRKALLQGLIDTDGYVARDGQIEFCTIRKGLAEQVQELIHSLGVKAKVIQGKATLNGRYVSEKYRVMFYMADAARLPRKAAYCKDGTKHPNVYLKVKFSGRADTVCVEVNSASHLFLCGKSMLPTHNSQIASRNFPAWLLGLLPDSHIILTSYGDSLATRHSRFIRDQIVAEEYQAVFGNKSNKIMPVELSSDSRSTEAWDLARPYRGGVKAAGVGGGITGLPAHLFIIDDPFKNREEAESESRRDGVDDWFKSAARTRLRPNAAVVIFHTRWHSDDLAGRLMKRMVSDPLASQYHVVCLPGLALENYPKTIEEQRKKMRDGVYLPLSDPLGRKAGEALCPQWYDKDYMLGTKADMGLYDFEALYQQSPYAKEGNTFKREWFTIVDHAPKDVWARIRAWDKAATSGGGARTASVKMTWGKDDFIYIEHSTADQLAPAERDEMMIEIGKEDYVNDGPFLIWHPQDPGSAGVDSAQAFNNLLANHGLIGTFDQVTGSKESYADMLATKAQAGRVRLVRGGWNDDLIDEYSAFPKGKKDRVDAGSSAYNVLRQIVERLKDEDDEEIVYEERVNISPV